MGSKYLKGRILIVDDDEDDYIIMSDYIKMIPGNQYELDWAFNYNTALQKLSTDTYNICFVDYRLGAKTGVDFLGEANELGVKTPIVLLTGKGNYNVDIQAMKLGAVDYLIKTELSVEKLERTIRYALERTFAKEALQYNEKKYRTIFEQSKDVIFICNNSFEIVEINSAAIELFKLETDALIGKTIFNLIYNDEVKTALKAELIETGVIPEKEVIFLSADNEEKHCLLSINKNDNILDNTSWQGIIHDITTIKKIEKSNIQAEKLAAASRLVRTLAHEVRNPLNNILLSSEQLIELNKNEELSLFIDIIKRNGNRINDLIRELLYTAKPKELTQSCHIAQSLLDEIVAVTIDKLTLKKIKLEIDYPNEVIDLSVDRDKIKLAILNIVNNAIDAMEPEKGILCLRLFKNDVGVNIQIQDNGCGISEENLGRLFEPYFTQKRNGIGLGLTFSLSIFQAYKATIDVKSKVGSGSTFTITFPQNVNC